MMSRPSQVVVDFGDTDAHSSTDETERTPSKRRRRTAVSFKRRKTKFSQMEQNRALRPRNSIFEPQTLNRRLYKLTKKVDASVGMTGVYASHLKAVENHIGTDMVIYFKELIWLCATPFFGLILVLGFIVAPQIYLRFTTMNGYQSNGDFQWHNLITGEGWLQDTELFQGFYSSDRVDNTEYLMPTAYLLTTLVAFFLYLVWIAKSLSDALSNKYVERWTKKARKSEDTITGAAVPKLFSAWDFSVCEKATAHVRRNLIWEEIESFVRPRGRSKAQEAAEKQQLFLNIIISLFLVCLIFGLSAGVWFVAVNVNPINVPELLVVPILTSAASILMPMLFNAFEMFEKYINRKIGLWVSMLRMLFLQLGLFTAIVFYLISAAKCGRLASSSSFYSVCYAMNEDFVRNMSKRCWETWIGQEVYRWQVLDLFVLILVSLIVNGGWKLLSKCGAGNGPVANVPQLLLHLLLSQSLSWFGFFFTPLLPLLMMIKLTILFFWFRFLLTVTCRPSQKPWQTRQVASFFRMALIVSFILAFVAFLMSILMVKPTTTCGPFRNMTSVTKALPEVTNNQITSQSDNALLILSYFNTLGFKIFVTVVLIVLLLFFRRRATRKHKTLKQLRRSIQMVTKDKVYYMKMLQTHARQNPYQMVKKLPVARLVQRVPSDVSIHRSGADSGIATPVSLPSAVVNVDTPSTPNTDQPSTHETPEQLSVHDINISDIQQGPESIHDLQEVPEPLSDLQRVPEPLSDPEQAPEQMADLQRGPESMYDLQQAPEQMPDRPDLQETPESVPDRPDLQQAPDSLSEGPGLQEEPEIASIHSVELQQLSALPMVAGQQSAATSGQSSVNSRDRLMPEASPDELLQSMPLPDY